MQGYKGNDANNIDDLASSFRPYSPLRVVSLSTALAQNVDYHLDQVAEVDANLNNDPADIAFLSR
jgi:hypothetical protein